MRHRMVLTFTAKTGHCMILCGGISRNRHIGLRAHLLGSMELSVLLGQFTCIRGMSCGSSADTGKTISMRIPVMNIAWNTFDSDGHR